MRAGMILLVAGAIAGCAEEPRPAARASLNRLSATTFELVPNEQQHPYCLIFTVSATGVLRQLTMSRDNLSYVCPSGKPVGGRVYRVPMDEGAVKVQVLFSSQKLNAASVAQQLLDLRERPQIASFDLRLPGYAALETLSFAPEADAPPALGGVVGQDGAFDSDAGSP